MKLRLFAPLLVAALLAFGAVLAACGDNGGELTLEDYFQQFNAITDDVTAQFEAVEDEFPGLYQERAATRDAFDKMDVIFEEGLGQLDGLNPPDEVKQSHKGFRDGVAAQQRVFQEAADEIADIESVSELGQVLQARGADLEATSTQINASCLALQKTADDNDIDVDLECEQE
jgi:hypothetical protein